MLFDFSSLISDFSIDLCQRTFLFSLDYFVLPLGKAKKYKFSFGFSLAYSASDLRSKVLTLGKAKKNKFSFGFSLAYSYLCTR